MNSPLVCTFSVLDMAVLPKPWADYSKQFSQFIGQFLQTILERKKKMYYYWIHKHLMLHNQNK